MNRFLKKYWWIIGIIIIYFLMQKNKNKNIIPEKRGVSDKIPPIKTLPLNDKNTLLQTFDLA